MAAGINLVQAPADRVLIIERIFDAPRALVYRAWTDPVHIAQWMGPRGFTCTHCETDLRPGGKYRFGMRSPEGTEHWQQGVFKEIVEPEKIVRTYCWADANGNPTRPETLLTILLEDHQGKTKLTLHQAIFESATACDAHRGGWTTSLDKLAEYVAGIQK